MVGIRKLAVVVLAAAGYLPAPALASEQGADSLTTHVVVDSTVTGYWSNPVLYDLRPDSSLVMPVITISASRINPDALLPNTVVRLDREDVERFQPASVADALVTVPGVDLVKTGAWSARPALRGMSGDRVLLKIDGVRVNPVRGHGPDPSIAGLDQIESIEVEPGASSAQNGSDALGGVIDIITRVPLLAPEGQLTSSVSMRSSAPGHGRNAALQMRLSQPNYGFEVRGSMGELESLTTADGALDNSGYRDESLSVRGGLQFGRFTSDAQFSRYSAYDVGLPAFASASGNAGVYPLRRRDALRLESEFKTDGWIDEARVLMDWQDQFADFRETTVDSTFFRENFVARTVTVAQENVRTESVGIVPELRLRVGGGVELFGEARQQSSNGPRSETSSVYNRQGDETGSSGSLTPSMPRSSRTSFAGGMNATRYVEWFRVTGSLRYDSVESRADDVPERGLIASDQLDQRWSASLGASRKFGPGRFYGQVSNGFRVPGLDERYYNGFMHGGLYLFGNADLRAERSQSYELGVRFEDLWSGALDFARVSVYRSDVEDMITFQYVDQLFLVPRFQYQNIDQARLSGVEASARFRIHRASLTTNASVPQGVDVDTGQRISTLGPTRISIELAQPLHDSFSMYLRSRWSDAMPGSGDELGQPSFWTTSVEAELRRWDLSLSVAIRNLFDLEYTEPLSSIPEPGRTLALAVRYNARLWSGGHSSTEVDE